MMKVAFKINYDKLSEVVFFIYVCFFYAFPQQILKAEVFLLVLLLPRLKKIKLNVFLGWSLAYLLVLFFSVIYSIDPENSFITSLKITKSLLFSNLLIISSTSREKIENVFKSFIVAGFVLIIRILLIFPVSELGKKRIHISELFNANDLALKWCISLIFLLYFVFIKKRKHILNIILTLIFYIMIIFTGSKKGFIFGSVSLFLMYLFNIKNKKKFFCSFFVIFGIILVFYDDFIHIPIVYDILGKRMEYMINSFLGRGEVDISTIERISMISDGFEYFSNKAFLGHGISTYYKLSPYGTYSHNNYIELLVGVGIFGTVVYYFIYIYNLILSFKVLKKQNYIIVPSCILSVVLPILGVALVSYDSRMYNFILALNFLIGNMLKKLSYIIK